jgi:hypothetical protein
MMALFDANIILLSYSILDMGNVISKKSKGGTNKFSPIVIRGNKYMKRTNREAKK